MTKTEFIQDKSGIWIPENTKLEDHSAKTRNYAKLSEFSKFRRINLVGIPVLEADNLDERVEEANKLIRQALNQKEIGLDKKDFMIRSALTFEDTEEHRAAGIGRSVRLQDIKSLDGTLRYDILDLRYNKDVQEYIRKNKIRNFGIGLQLCNTVTNSHSDSPAYSGSVKLIAPDLAEVVVNSGFSFDKRNQNKAGDFRVLCELKDKEWRNLFERTDSKYDSTYQIPQELVKELLTYLYFLKKKKDFSQGMDFEYVQPTKDSEVFIVQYASIKFMPEPKLSTVNFQYYNNPDMEYSQIVGCGEGFFPPEKIFFIKYSTFQDLRDLKKFNGKNPEGYLIINQGTQIEDITRDISPYEATSNATAIVDIGNHQTNLSDHNVNMCREDGKMLLVPNNWIPAEDKFSFKVDINHFKSTGASIQVNERTQECKLSFGDVWKK